VFGVASLVQSLVYGLEAKKDWFETHQRKEFLFSYNAEMHHIFCGYRGNVPGVKWSQREAESLSSAEFKKDWRHTITSPCCHGENGDKFTLTL